MMSWDVTLDDFDVSDLILDSVVHCPKEGFGFSHMIM